MDYKIVTLAEVCDLVAGFAFKSPHFGDYDAKVIKITHITPPDVDMDNLVGVDMSKYDEEKLKKYIVREGDYVMAMTGATIGKMGRINSGQAYLNQRVLAFRNKDIIDKEYLYYCLQQYSFGQFILNHIDSESAQPNISANTVGQYEIKLPSMEVQKRISAFLGLFDEKTRNNERINELLDSQAKAIFRQWFIDNPERASWGETTFGNIIESTLGGDWGKDNETGNYTEKVICVRGADIPDLIEGKKGKMPTRYILPKNFANKKLVAGDLVVEISGGSPTQSTGRIGAISQSLLERYDDGMICTNFCRALKPKAGYSMFIYYYWQYLYENKVFFAYENGTTGIKNLDLSGFLQNEAICDAPYDLIMKFNDFCKTVFDFIFANGTQSDQLLEVRNAVLRKVFDDELDI